MTERAVETFDQEIERILDDVRRSEDPNRGVVSSRGCTPGCDHVAYRVEVIRLWLDR
jgi:hypothetical protein